MSKYLLVFLLLISTLFVKSQVGTGQWYLLPVNTGSVDIVNNENLIYCAFPNCVVEYDITEQSTSLWSSTSGLSDIEISCMYFDSLSNSLFIGYENGNIDQIKDNRVINIPAIKLAQVQGNKSVRKIKGNQGFVYLATGLGIVKINPIKSEVADTYYPPAGTDGLIDVEFVGDTIFALSQSNMFRGILSDPSLADPNQWTVDSRIPNLTTEILRELINYQDNLMLAMEFPGYMQDSIYKVGNTTLETIVLQNNLGIEFNSLNSYNGNLVVNSSGAIYQLNSSFELESISSKLSFAGIMYPKQSIAYKDAIWVADEFQGMCQYYHDWRAEKIVVDGMPKKDAFRMSSEKGMIAIAGGSIDGINSTYNNAGFYIYEDGKWRVFDKDNTALWSGKEIYDYIGISVNPNNTNQIAVGTYSEVGVSIMESGSTIDKVFTDENSILEQTSLGNGKTLVSDLKYDAKGNLWVLNGYSINPLKVYSKEGVWTAVSTSSSVSNKISRDLIIDYNDNKWFSIPGAGMVVFNDNGTPSITTDDKYKILNTGSSTGALPSNNVFAIAVDFDHKIWIGTDAGFAILSNSNNVVDANAGEYNVQRIKLDFEGSVEYLLGNTAISAIEVDGGNRKWLGTQNTGIYLLSADGQTILESFNTSNSPLISNTILDLELNNKTGEMYITTDIGLIIFRTDATYQETDYKNVKVFPNPVQPYYNGLITIQGLKYNSDVRITDAGGNLVYKTTTNGGTATWDGKNPSGVPVVTGEYSIWSAPNEGKGHNVGKVIIIR